MTNGSTRLQFKRLPNGVDVPMPVYATDGAAGIDIHAAETVTLYPLESVMVKTGFAVEIPPGFELQVRPRSGLAANHGVIVPNSPGTLDCDYRGEIMVILMVLHPKNYVVLKGDRIAQLVLCPVTRATIEEVQTLSETVRGDGGFGSTGIR